MSVTPKFSLDVAEKMSLATNDEFSKETQLFRKIKNMVLPKLKLENSIYQSEHRRLYKKRNQRSKKVVNDEIVSKLADEISFLHESENLKKSQIESGQKSTGSMLDNSITLNSSINSQNFARKMAAKLEQEMLRAKTL